jgi:hypothetical protein
MMPGSVIEFAGLPGSGKTSSIQLLMQESDSRGLLPARILKILRLTRVDRALLPYTYLKCNALLRMSGTDQSARAPRNGKLKNTLSSLWATRPGKDEIGTDLETELLFFLNDTLTRSIAARTAAALTRSCLVVDELWAQAVIGVWLRLPDAERQIFWVRTGLRMTGKNRFLWFTITGAHSINRDVARGGRPVMRYARDRMADADSFASQLDHLSLLFVKDADPTATIDTGEVQDPNQLASQIREQIRNVSGRSKLMFWPRGNDSAAGNPPGR